MNQQQIKDKIKLDFDTNKGNPDQFSSELKFKSDCQINEITAFYSHRLSLIDKFLNIVGHIS